MSEETDNGSSGSGTKWKNTRAAKGIKAFGDRMQQEGQDMVRSSQEASQRAMTAREEDPGLEQRQMAQPSSYRRGGKVRKSGMAKVHRGEVVLTKKRANKLRKKLRGKRGRE